MSISADKCFWCDKPAIKTTWIKDVGTVGDCGKSHLPPLSNGSNWTHRNGTCPCGSGKKYKKCCIGETL
jgi:uncharacterized protein YecA (UPF0149 family)